LASLTLALFLAAVVPVPYVLYTPGGAQPVTVHISDATSYPTSSPIAFTTVSSSQRTSLLEAVRGWLDDDIQVNPTGGQSRGERTCVNAQLMDTSKLAAEMVALRYLKLPVTVATSGSAVIGVYRDAPAFGHVDEGDVITAVDGQPVDKVDALRPLLQVGGPGTTHELTVERCGGLRHDTVRLKTIKSPQDPSQAIVGIAVQDRIDPANVKLPFRIAIESGDVGGPSAGLAFTLALLDALTPGDLTGGHRVAVTGTMEFDGTVGPVGGGVQKAVAVRNAGYEAFLVPSDEYAQVRARIGGDVRVIAVDTLLEALDALRSLGGNVAALQPAGTAPAS